MKNKVPVSVLIMSKNEEMNIRHCLESVKWAGEIVVVDSCSTDKTLEIVKEYTNKIYRYRWDGKWPKKSWSFEVPKFSYDWILMIDADERATLEFKKELESIVTEEDNEFSGYLVRYYYWFLGKYIKFGDPVKKLVLFRKSKSHFEKHDISGAEGIQDLEVGHEYPIVNGKIGHTKSPLLHLDMRSLYFYFDRHNRYSTWEAELLFRKTFGKNSGAEIRGKTGGSIIEFRRLLKNIFLHLTLSTHTFFVWDFWMDIRACVIIFVSPFMPIKLA